MCNTDLLKLHLYLKTKKHKNIENNKTFSFSSNPQELESLNSLSDWLSLGSEVIVFVVIMRLHGDATHGTACFIFGLTSVFAILQQSLILLSSIFY